MRAPSLADRVLAALPGFASPPLAREMAARLETDEPHVRLAFERLERDGRAKIVRRGRGLHLVPSDYPGLICVNCRAEFERGRKSKRCCCSRACSVAWSWKNPVTAARRRDGIIAERQSPAARQRARDINEKRWARPGEREKLSEMNRQRWADPYQNAKQSVAIQKRAQTAERRAAQATAIKDRWNDPAGRERLLSGIRKTKGSPEYRKRFGDQLRARWADPLERERLMKATERNRQLALAATKRKAAMRKGSE